MNKGSAIFLILFVMLGTLDLKAQDPQFSQYYAAPLYLNPGFTGSTEQQRVALNHRVQWPNLPQAFSTFSASYEFYDPYLKSGFGILATTDKMGSASWRTSFVGVLYAFKLQLNNNWVISPGLNFSYGINGIDRSRLSLRDGLAFNGISIDPELDRLGNSSFFDFSSGVVMYNRKWWFGVASHHMNRPNISILGDESRLPVKYTIHTGVTIPMYNGPKQLSGVHYLTPSIIYRRQGQSFQQLDAGLRYHIDPVAIGIWYRGIPIGGETREEDEIVPVSQRDALVFIASLMFNDFQFGYSFDFTISELQTTTGGSHEISLIYEFSVKNVKKQTKKRDKLIPCPSFIQKKGLSY